MQPNDRLLPTETSAVVCNIRCNDEDCDYVGETGLTLLTRLYEHKWAAQKLDPNAQLVARIGETGHAFDIQGATIIGRGNSKAERLTLEAWYSDANSVNRHLDLPAAYKVLRQYVSKGRNKARTYDRIANKEEPTTSRPEEEAGSPELSTLGTSHYTNFCS
ncbi:unnamed protein product [Dibothriocephalus latus]|uniref:Uncharacterized protein n=1 Tax=Dibothriocephalus latus TaxID=60516 RepID=A0A3P6PW60_DIBLA|nr:unnamed protein product [Dibothriocephalus latus]